MILFLLAKVVKGIARSLACIGPAKNSCEILRHVLVLLVFHSHCLRCSWAAFSGLGMDHQHKGLLIFGG